MQHHARSIFTILAAAGALAAVSVIGAPPASAFPSAAGGDQEAREKKPELPPGHPPLDEGLPPGHPPLDGLPAGHPPIDGGLPPGHPPIGDERPPGHPTLTGATGQRDEPAVRLVPADPEDVQNVERIVSAYYEALSGAAGEERNWDRFRSLFIPEARLISAQPLGENQPCAVMTPEQFVQLNNAYFKSRGYFEADIKRRIERFGNAASVFSTYEARQSADQEAYSRGINSMQLVYDGKRWWIATVLWDFERPDNPIPAEYLPEDEQQ